MELKGNKNENAKVRTNSIFETLMRSEVAAQRINRPQTATNNGNFRSVILLAGSNIATTISRTRHRRSRRLNSISSCFRQTSIYGATKPGLNSRAVEAPCVLV